MADIAALRTLVDTLRRDLDTARARITTLETAAPPGAPPPPPPAAAAPPVTIKMAKPDPFDGTIANTEKFLHQCQLFLAGGTYDNKQKITLALSYMTKGRALIWGELKIQELNALTPPFGTVTYAAFETQVRQAFGDSDRAATARLKIKTVKQGNASADDYIVDFDQYKDLTLYNNDALIQAFKEGLNQPLLSKIYALPAMPTTIQEWQQWASKLDRQYRELLATTSSRSKTSSSSSSFPSRNVSSPRRITTSPRMSSGGRPPRYNPGFNRPSTET